MKASSLPPPAAVPPITAEPATPVAAGGDATSAADFVGMLMQLLGGTAPAALTTTSTTTKAIDTDTETEDSTDLAAMLAMPMAPMPWAALPVTGTNEGGDPLEMLGLASGADRGETQALLSSLESDLADVLDQPAPDAGGNANDGIGSLSPLTDLAAAKNAQTETPASRVHAPVGSPQWADELSTKLTWMVDRGQQSASLKLTPDNMGPLEVRISIGEDKSASVWFGAQNADTRAAIENALPRLREMFATQGLSLADSGVFREPPRDQPTPAPQNFRGNGDSGVQEGEIMITTRATSLLDAYA